MQVLLKGSNQAVTISISQYLFQKILFYIENLDEAKIAAS